MEEKKNRLSYIDTARGIAIIAIILGHLGNSDLNRVVFTFHVPIFFLISGYFISRKDSYPAFIRKKARSLLVPYLTASLLIILFSIIRNIYYPTGESHKAVAMDWLKAALYGAGDTWDKPFHIRGIGAIWFLWATFWGLILLRPILRLPRIFRPILCFGLPYAGYYSFRHYYWFPLSIQAGLAALGFMYIGFLAKEYRNTLDKIPEKGKQLAMLLSFILWFTFIYDFKVFWLVHCDFGRGWWDILRSLAGCWCVILIAKMLDHSFKHLAGWLASPGRNSILILCLHILELNCFPWRNFTDYLGRCGIAPLNILYIRIALKLVWALGLTFILTRLRPVRKLFCLKEK